MRLVCRPHPVCSAEWLGCGAASVLRPIGSQEACWRDVCDWLCDSSNVCETIVLSFKSFKNKLTDQIILIVINFFYFFNLNAADNREFRPPGGNIALFLWQSPNYSKRKRKRCPLEGVTHFFFNLEQQAQEAAHLRYSVISTDLHGIRCGKQFAV